MSPIISITISAYRPDNIADNTLVHQAILDEVNECARLSGWHGTAIEQYGIRNGMIVVTVIAADAPATLDDLRAYRENQKLHEEELTQPVS